MMDRFESFGVIVRTLIRSGGHGWVFLVGLLVSFSGVSGAEPGPVNSANLRAAAGRAVSFLSVEVGIWRKENGCYSCHNHGDAARALYAARLKGIPLVDGWIEETSDWLLHPERWDDNPGDPGFSDRTLARVQFGAAALARFQGGREGAETALKKAAELVAECQSAGGEWRLEGSQSIGSPTAYGDILMTHMALETVRGAVGIGHGNELNPVVIRAGEWLRRVPVRTVLDAASLLLALAGQTDSESLSRKELALAIIRKGQAGSGGWGPHVTAPPEVFDTALVVLALQKVPLDAGLRDRIWRAVGFLMARQEPDGGWVETTRPSGNQSYAQRMSTSGWATLALLEVMTEE
ncbi:MAG: hypothetical protein K9N62_18125 [Verrucomicrobia bacterium]|nr:hypothetical protein [Verrucomicrobiota bacterium]